MTTKAILASAGALVALFTAGAAFADTAMLPGLYENKVRMPQYDNETETTRDCLTPAEAKNATIERHLAETLKDKSCKYSSRSISGGKFTLAGTCVAEGGAKSSFKQTGTFTPTSLNMTMTGFVTIGGQKMDIGMIMSSRRIAASCPAGSDD